MASDLARRGEPFVYAVVVSRQPPSSAQTGNMAIITAAGAVHGWLGGSCTKESVAREARRALAEGTGRLLVLTPDGSLAPRSGVTVEAMTCASGGSVEIYVEPVLPAPRLVVFGESPIATALLRIGAAAGYITVTPADASHNGEGLVPIEPARRPGASRTFAVVATMGENDEPSIVAALALNPAYLGVVASTRRFAQIRETLLAQGVRAAALDGIKSPAGLDIGARGPEQIALSILSEIVQREAAAADPGPATPPPAPAALDPVCGMTVDPTTARHTEEHAGRTFYFCCGGCRARFVAQPERYT